MMPLCAASPLLSSPPTPLPPDMMGMGPMGGIGLGGPRGPNMMQAGWAVRCAALRCTGPRLASSFLSSSSQPSSHSPSSHPASTLLPLQNMAELAILRRANESVQSAANDMGQARHTRCCCSRAAAAPLQLQLQACWAPTANHCRAPACRAGAPAAGRGAAADRPRNHEERQVSTRRGRRLVCQLRPLLHVLSPLACVPRSLHAHRPPLNHPHTPTTPSLQSRHLPERAVWRHGEPPRHQIVSDFLHSDMLHSPARLHISAAAPRPRLEPLSLDLSLPLPSHR